MYPSVLKSDQNGIEMENKQLERVKRENRLKSDQNGIEMKSLIFLSPYNA